MINRQNALFFILGGFFITNALVAELIGGKLFSVPIPESVQIFLSLFNIHDQSFVLSLGILIWPIVFIATDLVNEFFGYRGVRFYTFITVGLIGYTFVILYFARLVPAVDFSPVQDAPFDTVFGTSQAIIIGSIIAFAVSQLVDVIVFRYIRHKTGGRTFWLWARATGSTVVSQLVDTFVIGGIAFYLPGRLTLEQYMKVSIVGYLFKVGVAILTTPLCYLGHGLINRFLGRDEAHRLAEKAAHEKPAAWYGV